MTGLLVLPLRLARLPVGSERLSGGSQRGAVRLDEHSCSPLSAETSFHRLGVARGPDNAIAEGDAQNYAVPASAIPCSGESVDMEFRDGLTDICFSDDFAALRVPPLSRRRGPPLPPSPQEHQIVVDKALPVDWFGKLHGRERHAEKLLNFFGTG